MKSNLRLLLPASIILFFFAACSTNQDTEPNVYLKWKLLNDSSFVRMKDSTSYTLYTIPPERGGSRFYYKITTVGDTSSVSPLASDTIVANYRGRLMNGTIFDQSFKGIDPKTDSTATPIRLVTSNLIKGWVENLMQMKTGECRTIVIPQELGYGAYFVGVIPPYSTLKFEIQLVSVKKKAN